MSKFVRVCECGNAKDLGDEACARCAAIERNLWHWLPSLERHEKVKAMTDSERGQVEFEARFYGLARMVTESHKTGLKKGPRLQILYGQ